MGLKCSRIGTALPLPLLRGGPGWGCLRESHCPSGESFPHPERMLRCDPTSPASGRGKRDYGQID
jgi:hypothetical protein